MPSFTRDDQSLNRLAPQIVQYALRDHRRARDVCIETAKFVRCIPESSQLFAKQLFGQSVFLRRLENAIPRNRRLAQVIVEGDRQLLAYACCNRRA